MSAEIMYWLQGWHPDTEEWGALCLSSSGVGSLVTKPCTKDQVKVDLVAAEKILASDRRFFSDVLIRVIEMRVHVLDKDAAFIWAARLEARENDDRKRSS